MTGLEKVAGYKEEKEELKKIIKVFANYEKYHKKGIYIPKGIILQGPPGCGKTLLAKALSEEVKVKFVCFKPDSNSDKTLQNLMKCFKNAKSNAPSILYIDEIDKIADAYTSDETCRNATQFLLTELDGLNAESGVMVIASTNSYGKLPNSLIRSGRIDKKVKIDYPDLESREEILRLYLGKKKIFKEVNVKSLANKLENMSGADIKTLINNVLIEYVDKKDSIVTEDFTPLISQMKMEDIGRKWKSEEIAGRILIHEAGHSIVSGKLTGNYGAICGIKYGDAAGHTDFSSYLSDDTLDEFDNDNNSSKSYGQSLNSIKSEICKLLGGIISEKVIVGHYEDGGFGDLDQIGKCFTYARESGLLGIKTCLLSSHCYYAGLSNNRKNKIDKIENKILRECIRKTTRIIKRNKKLILKLVKKAQENDDVLSEKQVLEIVK